MNKCGNLSVRKLSASRQKSFKKWHKQVNNRCLFSLKVKSRNKRVPKLVNSVVQ